MHVINSFVKRKFVWSLRRIISILMIALPFLIGGIAADHAQAQVLLDTVNHKIDLGNFSGLNDSIIAMPVQIRNSYALGGITIRFIYDTTYLHPVVVATDTIIDSISQALPETTFVFTDSIVPSGGRWMNSQNGYYLASHAVASDVANREAGNILFYYSGALPYAYLAPKTDTVGEVMKLYFRVSSNAPMNGSTTITLRDEPWDTIAGQSGRMNNFSDTTGLILIYPSITGRATFTVDTPAVVIDPCPSDTCPDTCCSTAGNHAPAVAAIIPSAYEIYQGDSVRFTVSATDSDGDQLSLRAIGLPTNAQFLPSNPVTGTANVSGTFRFVPSFAQSGNFTIDFQATDEHSANSSIRTVSITVNVLDIDRLFTTSTYGGAPVGGVPGATPIIMPIDLATSKTVYGVQFDMSYPSQVVRIDSLVVTDRTPEYVVYENIGQVPDTVRVVTFGLDNEEILSGSGSAILNAYMRIDSEATPGDYWVHFYDAWESIDPNPAIPSLTLRTDSGIVQVDNYGDVNLDKKVNVADLVNVVAYIVGTYGLPPRNFATANVVRDIDVNVIDLVGIVNLIFGLPVSPSPIQNNSTDGLFASMKIEHGDLSPGQLTKLNVTGEFPEDVAGIQLQIDYDPEVMELQRPELADLTGAFILVYNDDHRGRMRMLIYTQQPWKPENSIPKGASDIVRLTANIKRGFSADDQTHIKITDAVLSSPNAKEIPVEGSSPVVPSSFTLYQNYPNPFNPDTRIEFDIKHEGGGRIENVKLDIYNILGQHVKTLVDYAVTAGHHSVGWDARDNDGRPVSTGIYLYRLQVGDKAQTRKMLLLK
jgi:hypothetical protein